MGAEYMVIGLAGMGVVALLWLLYLACKTSSRPYALSTLLFSSVTGLWFALDKTSPNLHWYFAIGFLAGSIIFGSHAALILIMEKMSRG